MEQIPRQVPQRNDPRHLPSPIDVDALLRKSNYFRDTTSHPGTLKAQDTVSGVSTLTRLLAFQGLPQTLDSSPDMVEYLNALTELDNHEIQQLPTYGAASVLIEVHGIAPGLKDLGIEYVIGISLRVGSGFSSCHRNLSIRR